jgi:hypothetical protein
MSTKIQAIETEYAGCRFRSRLEARWAVFFDAQRIAWDYEPEGFHLPGGACYLPDFWLPQVEMYAEVKPSGRNPDVVSIEPDAMEKIIALAMVTQCPVLLLDGPPRSTNYWAACPSRDTNRPDSEPPWGYIDFILDDGNDYHIHEHRFYSWTGEEYPTHSDFSGFSDGVAVKTALSARFEHGEIPTSSP